MSLDNGDRQWIAEQLAALNERLDAFETKLLAAFQQWDSPTEMRQRSQAASIRALEVAVDALEDRVKRLEDRQ
jgi:hypothetical protein